jgi:hypothetical protein
VHRLAVAVGVTGFVLAASLDSHFVTSAKVVTLPFLSVTDMVATVPSRFETHLTSRERTPPPQVAEQAPNAPATHECVSASVNSQPIDLATFSIVAISSAGMSVCACAAPTWQNSRSESRAGWQPAAQVEKVLLEAFALAEMHEFHFCWWVTAALPLPLAPVAASAAFDAAIQFSKQVGALSASHCSANPS